MSPRRRDDGFLDDLTELFARLPWWAGIPAIAATYVSVYLGAGLSEYLRPGRVTYALILSSLVLVAAALGQVMKSRRRGLRRKATSMAAIRELSWRRFEELVAEVFRQEGYVVEPTAPGVDGGVDLILRRDGETTFVQCKAWRAKQVGVERVRELYGVVAAEGADVGIVVTTGTFSQPAREFAEGRRIRLVSGQQLYSMINKAREVAPTAAAAGPLDSRQCPTCGSEMAQRVARQGPGAGQSFWGCSRYPACRGTRPA
jgi:restriction system protein